MIRDESVGVEQLLTIKHRNNVEELQHLLRSEPKILFPNIYGLFCILATDGLHLPEYPSDHQFEEVISALDDMCGGSLRRVDWWRENLYDHLFDSDLPPTFIYYVKSRRQDAINRKKKGKNASSECTAFGKVVVTKARKMMVVVRRMNKKWNGVAASVKDNWAARLEEVKSDFWSMEAHKRVDRLPSKYFTSKVYNPFDESVSDIRQRHFQKYLDEGDPDWHPPEWLSFLLCGEPGGPSRPNPVQSLPYHHGRVNVRRCTSLTCLSHHQFSQPFRLGHSLSPLPSAQSAVPVRTLVMTVVTMTMTMTTVVNKVTRTMAMSKRTGSMKGMKGMKSVWGTGNAKRPRGL